MRYSILAGLAILLIVIMAGLGIRTESTGKETTLRAVETAIVPQPSKPILPASAQTWRRIWSYPAGAPLSGAPVGYNGGWIVTTDKGRVVALDAKGVERWSCSLTNLSFAGSAAVAGETVVVAGSDGSVAGLDLASGKILWQAPGAAPLRHGPQAVRAGGTWAVVLLTPENGVLRCLDARDGRELWVSEPTNRSDGPPAAEGSLIAFGNCDSAIHLFNATNGVQMGQVPVGADSQMAGGVFVSEGRVYGGTRAGELVCAEIASLALSWHVALAGGEAFGTPVAARGLVAMGTAEGAVAAFDAKTGVGRWKVSVSNAVSALCIEDDSIFAVAGGRLLGLRLADGGQFFNLPIGDNVNGPVCNNHVLAVSDDGGNVIAVTGN